MSQAVLAQLRAIVGDSHVLTTGDLRAWELDQRRRYHGRALAVVRPGSTDEVAQILRACQAHRVAVVPQGGNTSLVGGAVPDHSGQQLLLCLTRLSAIRALDADNLTLTVEAGCTLQQVQDAAEGAHLLFPLRLASQGSCTIGGNLASNAGGTQVLRYGNARELCLGLEVVTPQGEIWHGLGGLRKDNTGYDLRDLFIGSEGTLGVITAATLRLFPRPATVLTALASLPSLDAALALLRLARAQLGPGLTGFEVMNAESLALLRRHQTQLAPPWPEAPWTALLEFSDSEHIEHAQQRLESVLAGALAQKWAQDAAVAHSLAQSASMWQMRESIPSAQAREGLNIKHDISLPTSAIARFVEHCDAAVRGLCPDARLITFGHLGDGNLHYNVQAPTGSDPKQFLQRHEGPINQTVYDAVQAHGGSFSAEHGIGQLKRDELRARKSPVALQMMRAIKAALDPLDLMNPGRVL